MGAASSAAAEAGGPSTSISSAAARDACCGQLGRGQLIDSHGSSIVHSGAEWRRQVELLVSCPDTELCKPCAHGASNAIAQRSSFDSSIYCM